MDFGDKTSVGGAFVYGFGLFLLLAIVSAVHTLYQTYVFQRHMHFWECKLTLLLSSISISEYTNCVRNQQKFSSQNKKKKIAKTKRGVASEL